MFRFQDISIKRKLTIIIMIASTVALLLVSAGLVTYEVFTFRRARVNDLSTLAAIIGNRSTAALAFKRHDDAGQTLRALAFEPHIIVAALYDAHGKLFASYSSPQATKQDFPARLEPDSVRFQNGRVVLFHEIYTGPDLAGVLYLESDLQTQLNQRLVRYAGIILLFTLTSWLVTLFLSGQLQRVISRPIVQLAKTARTVSSDRNYSVRAARQGRDELGRLIDDFNEMLGQIQQRDQELQTTRDKLETRVEERTQELSAEIAERKRTESALRKQFVRLSLLNQITHAISERQDMESIFHVVLGQLEDHLGLDLGVLALFDASSRTLNVTALHIRNQLLATQCDLHEGSVVPLAETDFQACAQGQTVYVSDTFKAPALFSEKLAVLGWRSVVAVPLLLEEKLFGVLISARLELYGFSSGDCEFLRMLSEHVALAAHQARLHKDLETAYHELRHTQANVLQHERLKALGQMASGIAHDVNNALSPVVGYADLLLHGNYGLDQKGTKFLRNIATAGRDIAHIIARLREFYRKREETESLRRLNLNLLVEEVVDMTRPRWRDIPQSNGITIEVQTELAPGLPRLVGIESEVREAFTNLLLNAVDAMPSGGKIILRTSVSERDGGTRPAKQVVVEFADTGVGMNEEIRKRCLEPFFSTKGKRGTGLGLAMVYGVMERHEGTIEIRTAPGQGATFRLVFPVRDKLPAAAPKAKKNPAPAGPLRILCVDDEPLLRELLSEMLERDGHEVQVSDSGQSGLDQFRFAREHGQPFDVVITDLGMPYVDGRKVAKTVKQESPQTPVVMLTGWGASIQEDGAKPEHVDVVISKPPRSRQLREVLKPFRSGRQERDRKPPNGGGGNGFHRDEAACLVV